jgi:mannose-6-phosphate isomerase-like protein (cupin superfamily)
MTKLWSAAALLPLALMAAAPVAAQPAATAAAPGQTAFIAAPDLRAEVEAMSHEVKPGGFLWRPVLKAGPSVAALEYWTSPRPPAIHPHQAEYVVVMAGSGALVSGGTMTDPHETQPGLIEGGRIEGGVTRELKVGDAFMVPAGVPHWFAIHGDRLVLLGTKLDQPN